MKAEKIIELATALTHGIPDSSTTQLALAQLNIILAECLNCENSIRAYKGLPTLEEAPYVRGVDDDIDFDSAITRGVIPFGLAAYIFRGRADDTNAQLNRNIYDASRINAMKTSYVDTVNAYATTDV